MNQDLLASHETLAGTRWQVRENQRARDLLHGLPAYAPFEKRLRGLAMQAKATPLLRAEDLWFQREEHEYSRVLVRGTPDGPPRVILDVADVAHREGAPVRLVWFCPSPDGSMLAFALEVSGSEHAVVSLIDVASGDGIPADIPWVPAWPVTWLPDSTGFFIDSRNVAGEEFVGEGDDLYLYRIGQETQASAEPIPTTLRFPRTCISPDGRYVALVMDDRLDYLRGPDGRWRSFLRDIPGAHIGEFIGDELIAIVTDGHPRGRIVRIPIASAADSSTWREIVSESDDVLLYVSVFEDRLVVGLTRQLSSVLEVRDLDGRLVTMLDLPENGTAGGHYGNNGLLGEPPYLRGRDEISFTFSTPVSSPAVYRYELPENRLTMVTPPAVVLEGYVVETLTAVSRDGTRVPATVIRSKDFDGPQPTLIEGYGNFGLAVLPSFSTFAVPVLEFGGVYVLAHLRGGGEFGREWWSAGRLERKQSTFDDLYAIAELLIADGVTTTDRLAFHGASGGGLTAGTALVQRPDLFAAIVARSPLLDLLNRDRDPLQESIASREFGSLRNPDHVAVMRSYSPVENVRAGVRYPACAFVAGENDPRTKAWQSRKMAALVGSATSGDAPVLLRVHGERGHVAVGVEAFAEENAEWLAFIAAHTGLQTHGAEGSMGRAHG